MSTFVLIHGAFHGAWCWDKVTPLLEQGGHEVVALDLPGHGEDQTPAIEVTLEAYADRVVETLDALPEPVMLVGHSLSGTVISQVAERRPRKIDKLVYLCALLLPSGKSAIEASQEDSGSVILKNTTVEPDLGRIVLAEEGMREALYHDCPEEDFERARRLITSQPLAPLGTPAEVTEANFGGVGRTRGHRRRGRARAPGAREVA